MTYTPTDQNNVGTPPPDDRGRMTLGKWLRPDLKYIAHVFDDGSILLRAVAK